jgi:hypothetical protein
MIAQVALVTTTISQLACSNIVSDRPQTYRFCTEPPDAGEEVSIDTSTRSAERIDIISKIQMCGDGCMVYPFLFSIPPKIPDGPAKAISWVDGPLTATMIRVRNDDAYEIRVTTEPYQSGEVVMPRQGNSIMLNSKLEITKLKLDDYPYALLPCGEPMNISIISRL